MWTDDFSIGVLNTNFTLQVTKFSHKTMHMRNVGSDSCVVVILVGARNASQSVGLRQHHTDEMIHEMAKTRLLTYQTLATNQAFYCQSCS